MRKITIITFLSFMTFSAIANDGNEKPKPVISNYSEVLNQIEYPAVCRSKGIEGTVIVKINVDKNGEMRSYKIVESPCSDLKKAVADAIPKLDFLPAEIDGQAVNSRIVVPVKFKLTY